MKKLLATLLLFAATTSFAQVRSASLTASGLTCSMCSKAIYKALLNVPTVKDVAVDIEHSKYTITFKENSTVAPDDIKKAVENAGFSVASMQLTAAFSNTDVYNDAHVVIDGSTYHFLNVEKQQLQGDHTITIVDKNYLPAAKRKEYSKYTTMKCFETGMMEPCCAKNGGASKRIYHVTM